VSAIVRYLTHPQVNIDPSVPVPKWGLSPEGRARTLRLAREGRFLRALVLIVSSGETKAIETSEILAAHCNARMIIREAMHENDRSSTGFLPPPAFEVMANRFFANPDVAVEGWEPARTAQARIVTETKRVLADAPSGDVLLVGHGGVGTLLRCHILGQPIARDRDQPGGGGNLHAFTRDNWRELHGWRALETECEGGK
jgi:broad specificity phosphatase PhoE